MRLAKPLVELVSASNGTLKVSSPASGGIISAVGACCNKLTTSCNNNNNAANNNVNNAASAPVTAARRALASTLTTPAVFWGGHGYFSSSSTRHFNNGDRTTSPSSSNPTVVSSNTNNNPISNIIINNSKILDSGCCESNKRRRRKKAAATTTLIAAASARLPRTGYLWVNINSCIVSSNNNPISNIINNNSKILHSGCCESNKRKKTTEKAAATTLIAAASALSRTGYWVNINSCGGSNGVLRRHFSTGPSSFFSAGSSSSSDPSSSPVAGEGSDISITKEETTTPGTRRKARVGSLREFMEEQHGVKPGKYVNFLLGMKPSEEEPGVFRGNPLYIHPSRKIAFGGCLLGQALSAAVASVPEGLYVHSLHNYFLDAGRQGCVDYHVENVRDGNTYCNRFVKAMQNGKKIVNMQVSFKKEEVDPFQFQSKMPTCPGPEELLSAAKLMETKLSEDLSDDLKKALRDRLPVDPVVEFRPVDPETMYRIKPLPPKRLTWVKISEKLDDDENFHRCATAFLSDYLIITTALLPNENSSQKFFLTSLDHSMWFHNKYRVDDWLLYETESCHAGEGIGLSTGRFWTKEGLLVASVAQQGVLRSLL